MDKKNSYHYANQSKEGGISKNTFLSSFSLILLQFENLFEKVFASM